MTALLNLDAYFERIQWGGDIRPTLDTLSGLLQAHMLNIPFENLDILLGRPVRLDLDSLQNKLIHARRGGYCFEHGTLFAAVLESLGFNPIRNTARVTVFASRTASPRTHMFLTVPLAEGTFVVDPGFGALAPRIPLPLINGTKTQAGHEAHWLIRDDRYWVLRVQTGDKTVDAWASTLEPENVVDFELGNHFTATYPTSPMVNRIMLRALTEHGRVSVMNRDLTIWESGKSKTVQLADRNALRALLIENFGFDLPEIERIQVPSIPEWN